MTEAMRAYGEQSKQNVEKNIRFAAGMEQHGEKLSVPCRSGVREARFHASASHAPAPTIFEIYGGGFTEGFVANDDRLRTRMRDATGYNVIGLDYRKAPDYPYPCAVEDVFDAICYFVKNAAEYRVEPTRLAVWGHSAGANLACAMALKAKETGAFSLRAQLLDYPWVDLCEPGSAKTSSPTGLTAERLDLMTSLYRRPEEAACRFVSPALAAPDELTGLAPAAVTLCGQDALRAEGARLVSRLIDAGVPVLVRTFPEASHGFLEHWFFREFYLDNMDPNERAGIPANLETLAEDGMAFQISAARYFLG